MSAFRLLALVLLAWVEGGCWEGATRETLATVLSVEGQASVSADGGHTFVALNSRHHPGKGEVLLTGAGSRLSLALLPNCLVRIEEGSSAEIVHIAVTKDGNETGGDMLARLAEVKLHRGRMLVSHVWGEARASLNIATENGEVSTPSNALFWLECTKGKTRVTCASGWVEFRRLGAPTSTRIPPGSIGQWPAGDGNLTQADADPRGQDDLQQATELEQKLGDLASRTRNVLPR